MLGCSDHGLMIFDKERETNFIKDFVEQKVKNLETYDNDYSDPVVEYRNETLSEEYLRLCKSLKK